MLFISFYTTVIYVVNNGFLNSAYMRLIAILIYVYITYVPKNIVQLFKNVIYYLLFMFLYVGIIISISLFLGISLENTWIKITVYIISSVILYIFAKYLWKMWKTNIKKEDLTYIVNIEGQEIEGFVDTANTVKDIVTNLDVMFVDSKYMNELVYYLSKCKKATLGINTINNTSKMEGYIFSNICVYKKKQMIGRIKKIIICFVDSNSLNKKYSALIGYNTYIENLKGVTFC